MRKELETYMGLVRAALWSKTAEWPEAQTESLLRLNAMQGTGALVYPSVLSEPTLSSYARAQMKCVCVHTMQQHVQLQHTLQTAWTALEKAGIHAVLMKGAGLAALYPDPQQRHWGDIDLFVGKDQYHPAAAVMRDTFPDALKFDEELDHYKHYNLIADGVSIEVHRVTVSMQHPLDERRYERMEKEGMIGETLMVNGLEVRVPEPTFNALFVFLHSWEHLLTQGANIRQFCDLALLLHHYADRIDRARLRRYLKELHLQDAWMLYVSIMHYHMGLEGDWKLFGSTSAAPRSEELLEDLLDGRLREPKSDKPSSPYRLIRKIQTMRSRLENAQRIKKYSPSYARHMAATTILHGASRLFAKDRHWE